MEVVKRKICLEDFISRTNTKWGYENGSWGKIAYDVVIPNYSPLLDIKEHLPIVDNIGEINDDGEIVRNQIQFNTLMEWHRWMDKFIDNIVFYKKCKRKKNGEDVYIWTETEYDFMEGETIPLYSQIGMINANSEDIENGSIIGVNSESEKFNTIFRSKIFEDGTALRYEKYLIKLINDVINGDTTTGVHKATPYIEIPINFNESIDSLGCYENYIDKWDSSISYVIGDTVLYFDENNKTWDCYELKTGNEIELTEMTGELCIFFENEINKGKYSIITLSDIDGYKDALIGSGLIVEGKPCMVMNDTKIFYPSIVYRSKYNEEIGEYMFNTADITYWEKVEIDDTHEENIKTVSESKLSNLVRRRKTVSEDGDILPFVINNKGEKYTDLCYNMGYTNHSITDSGEIYFDSLDKIEIYDTNVSQISDNGEVKPYTVIEMDGKRVKVTDKDNNVTYLTEKVGGVDKHFFTISYNLFPEKGDIKFFYRIGGIISNLEDDEPNIISNGVCYCEYYPFEKKNDLYNVKIPTSILPKDESFHELEIIEYELTSSDDPDTLSEWSNSKKREENIGNVYEFEDITEGIISTGYIKYMYYDENGKSVECEVKDVVAAFSGRYKQIDNTFYMEFKIISGEYSSNVKKLRYLYVIDKKWVDDVVKNVDIRLNTHILVEKDSCTLEIERGVTTYVQLLSRYYYIQINYEDRKTTFVNEYLDYKQEKTILSDVEYGGVAISDDNFIYSKIYKSPLDIGIDERKNEVDINIERGKSSFFELYHVLSEVNTMQDIENYRNNLFKI